MLVGVFVFLFAKPSFAAVEQTFNLNTQLTEPWTDNTKYTPQQYTFQNAGTISTITILMKNTQSISTLCIAETGVNDCTGSHRATLSATSTGPTISGHDTYYATFVPDATLTVSAGQNNLLITPQNVNYFVSLNSSTYIATGGYDQLGYSSTYYTLGTPIAHDLWVNFNGFTPSSSPLTTIDWYSTPTSTCDFQVWPLNFSGDFTPYNAVVMFGISPTYLSYIDWNLAMNYGASDLPEGAIYGGVLKETPLSEGYTFYAQAFLTEDNGTKIEDGTFNRIATSSLWEFIIAPNPESPTCPNVLATYPNSTWPTSTPNQYLPDTIDWCADWPSGTTLEIIKKALCESAQTLFRPSNQVVSKFDNLRSELQTKPPFGYFGANYGALASLQNSTTTSSTVESILPNWVETAQNFLSIPLLAFVSNALAAMVWLALVITTIIRFKHFEP